MEIQNKYKLVISAKTDGEMSTSKEGTISYITSEACALVCQTKSTLEEKFGLLYEHGRTKTFSEEEKKALEIFRENLDDLVNKVNKFQQDVSQVLDIQMRPGHEKGRLEINERDSGFGSKYVPSPRSSTDPFSRSNKDSTNRDSTLHKYIALTESYDPTSSCKFGSNTNDKNGSDENETTSSKKVSSSSTHSTDDKDDKCFTAPAEVSDKSDFVKSTKTCGDTETNVSWSDETERTSFYLGSSASVSSISTSGSEVSQYLPSSDSADDDPSSASTDGTKSSKQLNDISKPPSEEDNSKQP